MVLKVLIFVYSLVVPSAQPLDGCAELSQRLTRDSHLAAVRGLSPFDGCSRPGAARRDEPFVSSLLLLESDDSDSEGLVHVHAAMMRGFGTSDPDVSAVLIVRFGCQSGRYLSGRIPLRC